MSVRFYDDGDSYATTYRYLDSVGAQAKRSLDLYDTLSEKYEKRFAELEARIAELEAR